MTATQHKPPAPALGRQTGWTRLWRHGDRPYGVLVGAAALAVVGLVLVIAAVLWSDSELARDKFGLGFLVSARWDPAIDLVFGALPFIYGTIITSIVAVVIAVPVGIAAAVALAELAPARVSGPAGTLIELLAAVPSVIFGLWGLFVMIPVIVKPLGVTLETTLGFLPLFEGPIYGPSRLAAGLILAIMILPTITAISRDVFRAIPNDQREAAMALGATRWEAIWKVLIPYGASGFSGAVILGLARALGETIAVTMVIGNNLDLSISLLHPGYTMASVIANEFNEATFPLYTSALIAIGLVLFGVTLIVNMLARLLIGRVRSKEGQA